MGEVALSDLKHVPMVDAKLDQVTASLIKLKLMFGNQSIRSQPEGSSANHLGMPRSRLKHKRAQLFMMQMDDEELVDKEIEMVEGPGLVTMDTAADGKLQLS
ncbi:hypothetical protein VNO77_42824 [Canavalia gladiata]|uniref:Uncharacterized protein n=1 Tax=Canavalia gladiata TaxID=3824 RepID=A0AAN9JT40_CANGL